MIVSIRRRILTTVGCAVITLGFAAGIASADPLLDYTVTGTVGLFSTPPNPNAEIASFAGFNATHAQALVTAACPPGFTCTFEALQEIDLGLSVTTSGTVSIVSSNSTTTTIGCFLTGSDNCTTGGGGTGAGGVAVEGTLALTATDSLGNMVLATGPTASFSPIATNSGSGVNKVLNVAANSNTPYSGNGSAGVALGEIYATSDPTGSDFSTTWANEAAAYTGGTVNLNLGLNASYQAGSVTSGITVGGTNTATINGGTVTADYIFDYTETQNTVPGSTPEPATLFLMGSALVGIGLIRKRVRS